MNENMGVSKVNAKTVEQSGALAKLLVFSIALGVAPLGSYYLSLAYLWKGNSTYAAITAVALANIVLVAFIVMSVIEEKRGTTATAKQRPTETKKTQ
ncbi:hypothetical protein BDY19DRAFT_1084272 [Irpex rosettiformis]|uniref:Uncharacterized protein n=1 Tax=Irpex rosettiformis TaxID=378272 RepID=A0ACB8UC41_9APHY|nr:hypothetical protein BDY19DRAFT_1084272 [Irpex rosettiformis]